MEYKEILLSAVSALRSNILRTGLTMLGIVIGITSVILIVSLGQGGVAFITSELTAFGTNTFSINPGTDSFGSLVGANTLTMEDVEAIENDNSLTNVKSVAPVAVTSVVVEGNGEEKLLTVQGVTPEIYEVLAPDVVYGDFIVEENILDEERVVVMGIDAVETFFGEETDPVGETIQIDNKTFRIVGVTESTSFLAGGVLNNSLYVPISIVTDELVGEERLSEIDVSVEDPEAINQTIEDVKVLLRNQHGIDEGEEDDFQIQSFQDVLSTVQTITGLLTTMVAAISGISLIVGGVGVMNIMLVSVTERTREIGLLKAIGARQRDILTQFLMESVVMTVIGGLVGIILGISGAFLISVAVGVPFVVSVPAVLIAVGVSTFVGVVFGLYPARKAAQMSPIDALRYE